MASTAELELLIKARDQASGVLGAISKKAGGLANVAGKAVRAGALAGGVAVAGLGIAALKMGLDFEKSMAQVKTLLPDLSEEGFGQLQAGVFDLSKELGIATSEAVPALYQAISAGVPADNVLDFMTIAGKAAIGGATELETAVDGITGVVNTYGAEVVDAAKASDIMFTAVRLGKTTFGELSSSLSQVLPTAQSLGVTFEDVSAQLAVMTARNVPTAQAVTMMRQAMVEASKGGSKLSDAIIDLTGNSFAELIDKGATTSEIFDGLRSSMPEQEFKDLFGSVEGMNAALLISGPNAKDAASAFGEMGASVGASEAAFAVMEATAGRKLTKAINILKVELTKLGVKALPLISKALEKVTDFMQGFFAAITGEGVTSKGVFGMGEKVAVEALKIKDVLVNDILPVIKEVAKKFATGLSVMVDAFEPLVKFILDNKVAMIAAITAIGVAVLLAFGPGAIAIVAIIGLIALIGVIKDNWDSLKFVIIPVGIALGIVAGVIFALMIPALVAMAVAAFAAVIPFLILAAPIIAIVAVIALVVAAIMLLIKHFDKVKAALGAAASFIGEQAGKVKDFLVGAFNAVLDFLKANWPLILAIIMGPIGLIVLGVITFKDDIARIFGEVVTFIKGLPGKILGALGNLATLLTQKGKGLLAGFVKGYAGVWLTILTFFAELPGVLARRLVRGIGKLWNVGWDFLSGLWQGIKARAFSLFNDLKDLAGDILGAITDPLGIFSPSKVMRGVGVNLMEGLRQGIEGQSVRVNATVGSVAGGVVSAATGAPAGRGAANGATMHVTVNFRGPVFGLLDLDNHITQVVRDAVQGGAFRGVITTVGE